MQYKSQSSPSISNQRKSGFSTILAELEMLECLLCLKQAIRALNLVLIFINVYISIYSYFYNILIRNFGKHKIKLVAI